MTMFEKFAKQYRLRITSDTCGDPIVQGRLYKDANISEFSEDKLAMCFLVDGRPGAPSRQGLFNSTKAKCLEAGMTLHQEGDQEGIFVFDPTNAEQSKLAIKGVRAHVKKQLSPEQVAKLVASSAAHRFAAKKTVVEAIS